MAAILALSSCGGGSGGVSGPGDAPARVGVASLLSTVDVLELPLLQAGDQWYAHVRLKLADDGSVSLLGYQVVEARPLENHATLSPAAALEQLPTATGPFLLTVPRLHMDVEVFQDVRVLIAGGTWRYAEPPAPAQSLNAADLQGDSTLVARADQVVVLGGTSSAQTVQYPMQLEQRSYRFCVDGQDSAADGLTVIDPQGRTALAISQAGDCGQFDAQSGVHQVRVHLLPAGQDEPRPVFVQMPQAQQQAATQRLLGASADDDDYYLIEAVSALGNGVFTPAVVYATEIDPYLTCAGMLAVATHPKSRAAYVFDRANFFKFTKDARGRLSQLGKPYKCSDKAVPSVAVADSAVFPLVGFGWDVIDAYYHLHPAAGPVFVSAYEPQGRTFGLRADLPAPGPYGHAERQIEVIDSLFGVDLFLGAMFSSSTQQIRYRAKYRLRPSGFLAAAYPVPGEVALFSAPDCSGPALLLDQYDLPVLSPGSAGSFDGSMKLGGATQAVLYNRPYMSELGGSRQVWSPGCHRLDGAVKSVKVVRNTVDVVVSSKSCENCNLSGLNFAGRDLRGARLARANLTDAELAGANLRGADLRTTYLHHANLSNANLDEANLCGAQLQARASVASGDQQTPATLSGAYLRNANLSRANLTGVSLSYASFFSGTTQNTCKPSTSCDVYEKLNCASASGATLDGAKFDNAYLAGLGLDGVSARGVSFEKAVLVGANLSQAQLKPLSILATNFAGAYLQGVDFSNVDAADIRAAWWTGAVIQPNPVTGCAMQFKLEKPLLGFPGFQSGKSLSTCITESKPESTCVGYTYQRPTVLPVSPQGATSALDPGSKAASDGCQPPPAGPAPLCGSGFTANVNTCWSLHN
ncbi:pentapeptide repeat-containing protein [Variovorax terrae]|uniref:Pentapeptide repeat-containing protein n=1 Tax=Variovorax terrae TaxID=2923278 RepID=A0A9X2ALD9_9BURK|nr:pentapeptide repeat-containing protein [Variovorax terrae]MCJ0762618.1 pentapeptide repeat-containing protein [Variovorax terrae]